MISEKSANLHYVGYILTSFFSNFLFFLYDLEQTFHRTFFVSSLRHQANREKNTRTAY